jgi:hypothetical protein
MSRFAQIASIRTNTTPSPLAGGGNPKPNSPEKPDDEDTEDEEKIMTEQEIEKMKADARAEGVSATHARYTAVLASEHFAGREAMATKLLAKDGLSAEDIIDVLSGAPATAAAAPAALDKNSPDFKAAVDAQARDAMAKLLPTAADNADLLDGGETNGDTSPKAKADAKAQEVLASQRAFCGAPKSTTN